MKMADSEQQKTFASLTEEEYAEMLESWDTSADSFEKAEHLIGPVLKEFSKKPVHVMSIGAGSGYFDEVIIKDGGLQVEFYYGIEPFEGRRKQLEERASRWNIEHFIDQRYFDEDFQTDMKFDLVLFSHVLYFMPKPVESIMKAMSFLKDQGKLVILHNTKVGISALNCKMFEMLDSFSWKIATDGFYNHATSTIEALSESLNNLGVKHVLSEVESHLDVTEFIKKHATPKANYVVSFMLHTRYEKLPMVIQEEIYKMIKEGSVQTESGKYLFLVPMGMIEATKAQ